MEMHRPRSASPAEGASPLGDENVVTAGAAAVTEGLRNPTVLRPLGPGWEGQIGNRSRPRGRMTPMTDVVTLAARIASTIIVVWLLRAERRRRLRGTPPALRIPIPPYGSRRRERMDTDERRRRDDATGPSATMLDDDKPSIQTAPVHSMFGMLGGHSGGGGGGASWNGGSCDSDGGGDTGGGGGDCGGGGGSD
jgi:hypothetical protein